MMPKSAATDVGVGSGEKEEETGDTVKCLAEGMGGMTPGRTEARHASCERVARARSASSGRELE